MTRDRIGPSGLGPSAAKACAFFAAALVLAVLLLVGLEKSGVSPRLVGCALAVLVFGTVLAGAALSRTSRPDDFFIAGRRMPALYNGLAAGANANSATTFVGLAGLLLLLGYDGLAFAIGWTGGFVLIAALLAPYLRKFGGFSIPDFIARRYEGTVPGCWRSPSWSSARFSTWRPRPMPRA
jgi:cation/acetate symporter